VNFLPVFRQIRDFPRTRHPERPALSAQDGGTLWFDLFFLSRNSLTPRLCFSDDGVPDESGVGSLGWDVGDIWVPAPRWCCAGWGGMSAMTRDVGDPSSAGGATTR